jgi:hypothetical protein
VRRSRKIAQDRAINIVKNNYGITDLLPEEEMLELIIATVGKESFEFMVDQIELAIKEYQINS